jgi:hypothetical protein
MQEQTLPQGGTVQPTPANSFRMVVRYNIKDGTEVIDDTNELDVGICEVHLLHSALLTDQRCEHIRYYKACASGYC